MSHFDKSVFLNCRFDDDFTPILQAIHFFVVVMGLTPRHATERSDGGETRLEKIKGLIENSRYSIHDLSRCIPRKKGEMFRLNMPFDLGVDWGCRQYFGQGRDQKRFLILKEQRYQQALSDFSGCDIESHGGIFATAMKKTRDWLRQQTGIPADGPARMLFDYTRFQVWPDGRKRSLGYSGADIKTYPTFDLLEAIQSWVTLGKPETIRQDHVPNL